MNNLIRNNYIFGILFGLIILFLSIMPARLENNPSFIYIPNIDKVIHAFMYAIFSFLIFMDHRKRPKEKRIPSIMMMVIILLYSVMIEMIQEIFLPYRSGELLDILANLSGILFGWGILQLKSVRA